ncbi:MAG: hypothetical protein ACYSYL_15830 [Planctomycetota bacterium]
MMTEQQILLHVDQLLFVRDHGTPLDQSVVQVISIVGLFQAHGAHDPWPQG